MKELEGLQRRLMEMLLTFRDFTEERRLTFFLVGGSALGAYRHQGFIPWDDDVDVAMLRMDFEKLECYMILAENRMGDMVYSPVREHIIPEAPIGYLYDATHADKGYENVAKIDIHPIDGVPDSRFLRKVQKTSSLIYYLAEYRLPVKNKGQRIRNISKAILKITPEWALDAYMSITKQIFTYWDVFKCRDICSLFGVAGYETEVMPRSYLLPLDKGTFEGETFWVPGDIHRYLERLYGDYEKLPPQEERVPRHEIYRTYQDEE